MYPINPFNPYQGVNPSYIQGQTNIHNANGNQIVKVNGRGGADAYQMPPNSQALLLDETQPIVWLKQTDGAGYPTVSAYDITPHEEVKMPDMKSLEERIAKIEEVLKNESYHPSNVKQVANGSNTANDTADKILR